MPNADDITIPTSFETERLKLRIFSREDATGLHLALRESINELRTFLWHLPWIAEEQTPHSAEIRCQNAEENFRLQKDFPYLAFDKATDQLIASVGFHRPDWAERTSEVGYWVRSSETGRGYASEMVNQITSLALDSLGFKQIRLVIDEQNAGSRRVAERCGFSLESETPVADSHGDGIERMNFTYCRPSKWSARSSARDAERR